MKHQIARTSRFRRDYKAMKKRGYDMALLEKVVAMLADGIKLPPEYKDHPLVSNWSGYRECHIKSDWLLIYKYWDDKLILTLAATGTHSDLF